MEIITTIQLITINETLFVQVVSFLIFMFIINRVMFRPLRNTIAERRDYINQVQKDIAVSDQELIKLDQQIAKRESSFVRESTKLLKNAVDAGNQEAEGILAATWREIAAIRDEAHKDMDSRIAEARKSFERESESLAMEIIAKILDRRPTP